MGGAGADAGETGVTEVYRYTDAIDEMCMGSINELAGRVFRSIDPAGMRWRLTNSPDVSIFFSRSGGILTGFKIGYAMTHNRYYSWLGGVDPTYRRQGTASRLMQAQHQWLEDLPYTLVETHVAQSNPGMIQLNLAHGLVITGMFLKDKTPYYIMQKRLDP